MCLGSNAQFKPNQYIVIINHFLSCLCLLDFFLPNFDYTFSLNRANIESPFPFCTFHLSHLFQSHSTSPSNQHKDWSQWSTVNC